MILFQEGPMVTQWTRQKAQWLSQRGLSWPWTALTRPRIQVPIIFGTSSISTKLLNSSWRAQWQIRGQSMKVFRPLLLGVTAPSICRNGQCKHQTRLCTTVLWVTQWERAAGGAEHKPKGNRRLKSGRSIFCPWSEFSLHLEFFRKTNQAQV